jgi:hypothetical protein
MSKLGEKLLKKKQELMDQYDRGKKVTEQRRMDRKLKKQRQVENMADGTWKRVRLGLMGNKSMGEFCKEELRIRKELRDKKYGKE